MKANIVYFLGPILESLTSTGKSQLEESKSCEGSTTLDNEKIFNEGFIANKSNALDV